MTAQPGESRPVEVPRAELERALAAAQSWGFSLNTENQQLRAALCELHRSIGEFDGSDADQARFDDAHAKARELAPYEPEEGDPFGF